MAGKSKGPHQKTLTLHKLKQPKKEDVTGPDTQFDQREGKRVRSFCFSYLLGQGTNCFERRPFRAFVYGFEPHSLEQLNSEKEFIHLDCK